MNCCIFPKMPKTCYWDTSLLPGHGEIVATALVAHRIFPLL